MVQRTVSVGLLANVNNYVAGMERARMATEKTVAAAVGSEKQLRAQGEAFTKVGTVAMGAGALAAAGLALVVKATAEYGAKMAQLQSLSHASAEDMKKLSDAAMSQGKAFGYSATQVADAEIELTKAGRSTAQIMGGDLKGALALAAAGQMDVAQATSIAVSAVTEFRDTGATIPHVADDLAAGADKALGSVADLGMALNQSGLVAAQFGLNIDDTVGTLSAFAQGGLIGSDAGTSFKTMLTMLASPTKQAQAALDKYNITINDSKGNFVGITNLAGQLATKLSSKNGVDGAARRAALSTIFGNDAIRASQILYTQGAKGMQGWINSVNDSGFASAQAAGKLNSLQGDVQKLSAAFQTDLIEAGTGASGSLRGVVQTGTHLLEFLGGLPQPLKDAGVELTVAGAGVGLLGGAALIAVPKIIAFKAAMNDTNISGKSLARTLGKGGAIVAGLSAIAGGFAAMGVVGTANTQQLEQAGINIQHGWAGVDKVFKSAGSSLDSGKGLKESLDQLGDGGAFAAAAGPKWIDGATGILTFGLAATHLSDVYKSNEQTFDAMGQRLAGLAKTNYSAAASSFSGLVQKFHLTADETKNLLRTMPAYREELIALAGKAHVTASQQNLVNIAQGKGAAGARVAAAAAREAASAADKQATQLDALQGSAVGAKVDISALQKAIEGFGSAQLDARGATRAMYQAVDDATAAVKKNGKTLDVTTQKGRDNQAALDGIASAADAAASKTLKQTGSAKKAADVMQHGRDAFLKAADAMGLGGDKAKALADKLGLIPGNINVAVKATGFDAAQRAADILSGKLNNLDGQTANVYVSVHEQGNAGQIARNARYGYAAGGAIDGPGPRGVDSVPAMLAPGEHVLTTRDVDSLGGQSGVYRFRSALAAGAVQRFASGGAVAQGREDFVSAQRHGYANPIDPLSYVDDLRSMSRDTNWSASRRKTFDRAANQYEASMIRLASKADAASTKLADLKNSSAQMKSSIASSIAGGYQASGAGATSQASGWITRNGIRMQTYTSGVTASSLASYYKGGAASTKTFANQLKALAARKVNPALVAEIAGYGVEQGSPIAAAILSASTSQLASINSGYKAIQGNASAAGGTVANDNYAALIKSQQKTTDKLQKQLASDAERLRRIIARAFGLKGYASGTTSATGGFHLVGENGPELVHFGGGERVYTAAQTAYIRGTAQAGGHAGGTVQVKVQMPTTMNLIDHDNKIIGAVRVEAGKVATQVFRAEMTAGAVHLNGII